MSEAAVIRLDRGTMRIEPAFFPAQSTKIKKLAGEVRKSLEPQEAAASVTALLLELVMNAQTRVDQSFHLEQDEKDPARLTKIKALHDYDMRYYTNLKKDLDLWQELTK